MNEELIIELQQNLEAAGKLAYFNSTQSELITRCPYCGDSTKNSNHGHMYIGVTAPYSFFCQRCETKGFINLKNIKDFEVDNPELAIKINREAFHFLQQMYNLVLIFYKLGNYNMLLPYSAHNKMYHNAV